MLYCLPSLQSAERAARLFYWFVILISITAVLDVASLSLNRLPRLTFTGLALQLFFYRFWIVIGMAAAALLTCLPIRSAMKPPIQAFVRSDTFLDALCFSVSLSFFSIEIGKLSHDTEMRRFFLQSGYAVWFMYTVMMGEVVGAAGLFFKRTRLASSIMLVSLMCGAMATHFRNGDPFSDSLDAFYLCIVSGCIAALVATPVTARLRAG
jgi:hypothetical protein